MRKFLILLVILVLTFLILYFQYRLWALNAFIDSSKRIDYEAFGTYGDFFGGVIGTLFAIIGVIYIYYTYNNQIIFHKKEQIESRFFELLSLHEKNVEELKSIDKDIFKLYLRNIKNLVSIIDEFKNVKFKIWDNEEVVKLGYLYFFYGASEFTTERLFDMTIKVSDVNEFNLYIRDLGIEYNGEYATLGKYFRQLFQLVTYIDRKTELDYFEKEQYIKSLRVRLNIEEQYLLFLNSLVSNGLDWEKRKKCENQKLITKYNLLKNIPKEYPQINGVDFQSIYPNIQYEFLGDVKSDKRKWLENLYS